MLIKKDEEPFFYKFLSIAKEIIRKNKRYTPVFYGDDEKLYLVCHNYAAVYDFQSNLLLDDELREFGKIPYELSELPNGDMKLTKSEHFSCQESYLIAYDEFEDMDVEGPEVEVVEDDYQEEEQLDALLEDTVVPEELEDDFDPMLA